MNKQLNLRCPNCNLKQLYTRKDGSKKCKSCGYEFNEEEKVKE